MKLKFYFYQTPWADQTDVYLVGENANGVNIVAKPCDLVFEDIEDGMMPKEPTFKFTGPMSREFFPALVDALAKSGYTYESADKGELKATKVHLEDLRKIVFKKELGGEK